MIPTSPCTEDETFHNYVVILQTHSARIRVVQQDLHRKISLFTYYRAARLQPKLSLQAIVTLSNDCEYKETLFGNPKAVTVAGVSLHCNRCRSKRAGLYPLGFHQAM